MNAERIIKAAIPDADDSVMSHILWGMTPYPCGRITAKSLYKAASRFKRATANSITLCDLCDNKAVEGGYNCQKCLDALERIRVQIAADEEQIRLDTQRIIDSHQKKHDQA